MSVESPLVRVEGRQLRLSNLDKVLYPEADFGKRDVIDYYVAVAETILPHLRDRPVTLRRYPDGVTGQSFYEKNVSRHSPDWVRTVRIATPGSSTGAPHADYVMIDDLPTLVWAANLAALELHIPQWTVGPRGGKREPDLLVFDLDPGEPADIVECCRVAELIRELVEADGLTAYPKTSGSKGMQLYVPVRVGSADRTSAYAKDIAQRLAHEYPDLALSVMAKAARKGKVFVDWSQNNPKKTTVAPYSLRARPLPTVSAPLRWPEVRACEEAGDLRFTSDDVRDRLDRDGDLFDVRRNHRPLPG
ncbi:ATP-dependent DNA ligase [Amycolatopsis antarctica]|uniref:ATP-dependent DNA ligase n=1 Tax=Amycolatopsis antarctica TaxID=1854586 RepID=A0A263CXR8_9PSEU|nr:non-homologous end-joining DNA ligase [Amycolatopsis antarctica]OZM70942.1 ATP-dependent DNA ligase [Amycolatopsis antarctica]